MTWKCLLHSCSRRRRRRSRHRRRRRHRRSRISNQGNCQLYDIFRYKCTLPICLMNVIVNAFWTPIHHYHLPEIACCETCSVWHCVVNVELSQWLLMAWRPLNAKSPSSGVMLAGRSSAVYRHMLHCIIAMLWKMWYRQHSRGTSCTDRAKWRFAIF